MYEFQFRLLATLKMDATTKFRLLGKKHGKYPVIYQYSAEYPLDCIFGSPSLQIDKGRCLAFGGLLSNCRGIWIDIPYQLIFSGSKKTLDKRSTSSQKIQPYPGRRTSKT